MKQRTSTSPCHSSSPNAGSELTQWKAAEEELRGGRDSPWLQPGAACLQSKWELSADMQLVPHAGRITRDCCVWRIPLHIIIPLIMLKEQSPCTWIMALLGITNLNRETKLWEQPVQGRASLTNSSFILFFFFLFNLYIFQPNCAAVRTRKSFQELLSLLLAKWKSCAVFAFGPDSCPKTALQRFLLYLHCSTTTLVSQPQSPPAQDPLLFAILHMVWAHQTSVTSVMCKYLEGKNEVSKAANFHYLTGLLIHEDSL